MASVRKKLDKLFEKDKIDKLNARALGETRITPLKEINQLEKEGRHHEVEQVTPSPEAKQSGPRFDALATVRSATMPIINGMQEAASDGFAKLLDFMNERVEVMTSSEVNDNEIKNMAVMLSAEENRARNDRCDLLTGAIGNMLALRISKDRASRREHENMGIAHGMGRQSIGAEGGFDAIKHQIESLAGRKH